MFFSELSKYLRVVAQVPDHHSWRPQHPCWAWHKCSTCHKLAGTTHHSLVLIVCSMLCTHRDDGTLDLISQCDNAYECWNAGSNYQWTIWSGCDMNDDVLESTITKSFALNTLSTEILKKFLPKLLTFIVPHVAHRGLATDQPPSCIITPRLKKADAD